MDQLGAMRVLVAAVEGGSLSAAGRALGMPLATVSRKISALESRLKTRLLNRTTRGLAETESGRAYVAFCRRVLEDVDEAERAAAGEFREPRGELVVTAPIVFGRLHVMPVVTSFLQSFPEVQVSLLLGDRVSNLQEDAVDAAIRIGDLPDSRIVATRLGTVCLMVCASPSYLAEHGTPRHPRDLSKHELVFFSRMASPNTWKFADGKQTLTVAVRSRLTVNTAEAAIDGAIAGAGLTRVLSYQIRQALAAGTLTRVLRAFEPPAMPVSLLHPGGGRMPLKLRAFLDFVTPRLRARLHSGGSRPR